VGIDDHDTALAPKERPALQSGDESLHLGSERSLALLPASTAGYVETVDFVCPGLFQEAAGPLQHLLPFTGPGVGRPEDGMERFHLADGSAARLATRMRSRRMVTVPS